jgi:hydrogenase 3 maturation protease
LRGDDAVGVVVANRLRDWQSSGRDAGDAPSHLLAGAGEKPAGAASGVFNDALFVNGGSAPENVLGEVKAFQPDVIVFIDAAVMGRERGAVRLIDTRQEKISGISFCTHSLPLTIIADYIRQSLDCEIYVIGIEPGDMGFRPDCALSPPVAAAADEVVDAIVDASLPPA